MVSMRHLVRNTTKLKARFISSFDSDDAIAAKNKYITDMRRKESGYMKKLVAVSVVGLIAGYYYLVHVVDYPEEFCDAEE